MTVRQRMKMQSLLRGGWEPGSLRQQMIRVAAEEGGRGARRRSRSTSTLNPPSQTLNLFGGKPSTA